MPITAKLDEFGKPAWIALMVLGFWSGGRLACASSPSIGSGRMGCGHHGGTSRWQHKMERMQNKMDRMRGQDGRDGRPLWSQRRRAATAPSTNIAPRPCRRLEDEQREFHDFLERLRLAKDKTEFDQFMAERRNRPGRRNRRRQA